MFYLGLMVQDRKKPEHNTQLIKNDHSVVVACFFHSAEGDVWFGSWTPPPGGRRLMYKYFVSDGAGASDDNFEWLGQTTWGEPINRYVQIPGEEKSGKTITNISICISFQA